VRGRFVAASPAAAVDHHHDRVLATALRTVQVEAQQVGVDSLDACVADVELLFQRGSGGTPSGVERARLRERDEPVAVGVELPEQLRCAQLGGGQLAVLVSVPRLEGNLDGVGR
jgi:hypothetical protein